MITILFLFIIIAALCFVDLVLQVSMGLILLNDWQYHFMLSPFFERVLMTPMELKNKCFGCDEDKR